MIEARALVHFSVAWEQSSVDAIAFSASLTGDNLPAAGRPASKKGAIYGLRRSLKYAIQNIKIARINNNECNASPQHSQYTRIRDIVVAPPLGTGFGRAPGAFDAPVGAAVMGTEREGCLRGRAINHGRRIAS